MFCKKDIICSMLKKTRNIPYGSRQNAICQCIDKSVIRTRNTPNWYTQNTCAQTDIKRKKSKQDQPLEIRCLHGEKPLYKF